MNSKMTREKVLETVADARAKGKRADLSGMNLSSLDLSGLDLSHVDLSHADLRGTLLADANLRFTHLAYANLRHTVLTRADLYRANLRRADLTGVVLSEADLTSANLHGANLRGSYLHGANLTAVVLRGADMRDVKLCGLFLDGLPSGDLAFLPTPGGWQLTIGCWRGTTDELREMIAGEDWPEAEGEDIIMRRPMLEGMADACDAYAAAHPRALAEVKTAADRRGESR